MRTWSRYGMASSGALSGHGIDWTHPMARHLKIAFVGSESGNYLGTPANSPYVRNMAEPTQGVATTGNNGVGCSATALKVGYQTAGGSNVIPVPSGHPQRFKRPFTVAANVFGLTTGGSQIIFHQNYAAGGINTLVLHNSSGNFRVAFYDGASGYAKTSTTSVVTGREYTVHVVFDAGQIRFYINGVLDVVHAEDHSITDVVTSADTFRIGNEPTVSTGLSGAVGWIYAWGRGLNDEEIVEHYAYPHAMMGPPMGGLVGTQAASAIACRWSLMGVGQR